MKKLVLPLAITIFVVETAFFATSCSPVKTNPIVAASDSTANGNIVFNGQINTDQGQQAFAYLNKVRVNPSAFSQECNFNLSGFVSRPALTWNNLLQKAAEDKALDMYNRNYFAHRNPNGEGVDAKIQATGYNLDNVLYFVDRTTSNYESLASAGGSNTTTLTGIDAIRNLIKDGDYVVTGHRDHLLGVTPDRAKLTEIGIGWVPFKKDGLNQYICCVLIAKQK